MMEKERLHIYPVNDTRIHFTNSESCTCAPSVVETEKSVLIIHNAADGREFFEEDEREALLAGLRDMAAGKTTPAGQVYRELNKEAGRD